MLTNSIYVIYIGKFPQPKPRRSKKKLIRARHLKMYPQIIPYLEKPRLYLIINRKHNKLSYGDHRLEKLIKLVKENISLNASFIKSASSITSNIAHTIIYIIIKKMAEIMTLNQ